MGNPLYESLYGNVQNGSQPVGPLNMQDAMTQLRSNPEQLVRQAGYNLPDGIGSNPQSIVTYLIQSGQVTSPALQKIGPMIQGLMR